MLDSIRRTLRNLKGNTSGNATLLMALGLPALIGGSGLAVDTAQWYMWKRELQFAVDQAALAGAWARTNSDTSSNYVSRATQEYSANLAAVTTFDSGPTVALANYDGGTSNSVTVQASAAQALPFSSFITGNTTTVVANAQASFSTGASYTACMLAIHPSADSAFKFGGSVSGSSACGVGTLSDDENAAMKEVGNTNVPLGQMVAGGGIDSGFSNNGTLFPDTAGLFDPFADVETPSSSSSPARTYVCPTFAAATTVTEADVSVRTIITYTYTRGANAGAATAIAYTSGTGYLANVDDTDTESNEVVANGTVAGTTTVGPTTGAPEQVAGSGPNKIYRTATTTVITTYSDIDIETNPGSDGIAYLQPGIYPAISIACETHFAPGIYFVSGDIDFGQNQVVVGSDMMFVISGSNTIHINSNSDLTLSGITAARLTSDYGYSASDAEKLNLMLFWDKNSTDDFLMNGNANVSLNGTFYMPNRNARFNGNETTSGGCIMIAASTIEFTGNNNVTNFCKPDDADPMTIGGGAPSVKLVA